MPSEASKKPRSNPSCTSISSTAKPIPAIERTRRSLFETRLRQASGTERVSGSARRCRLSCRAAPQKISAGSARRNRMSDSIAEMTDMKTPTAKTPASCIGAIVTGSSVWARITE